MKKSVFIFFIFFGAALQAQRTDTIYLYNGDRITGEIRYMTDNKVNFKTDRAGVINVEWPSVSKIYSNNIFDIGTVGGQRYYGSLGYGNESREVLIVTTIGGVSLKMSDVLEINRIKENFWQQISGTISTNASYAKANENLQLNGGFDLTHRSKLYVNNIKANAVITSSKNSSQSQRTDASYSFKRLYTNNWFVNSGVQYQRNTELNIASRYQVLAGGGNYLVRRAGREFFVFSGISANLETDLEDLSEVTRNSELVLGTAYHRFKFRDPQFEISGNLTSYTSLNNLGRFRMDIDLQVLWEIFKDLKWNITFYNNFDTRPPGDESTKNDWSIMSGITYTLY